MTCAQGLLAVADHQNSALTQTIQNASDCGKEQRENPTSSHP